MVARRRALIEQPGEDASTARPPPPCCILPQAPLFVHTSNRPWPTNLIVIDNHRWYGIVSYYVQQMFRRVLGSHHLGTTVTPNPASEVHAEAVAASATCQSDACDRVALKIVNFSSFCQRVAGGREGGQGGCNRGHGG